MLKAMSKFQGVLKMFMLGMLKTILKTVLKYKKKHHHTLWHVLKLSARFHFSSSILHTFAMWDIYFQAHTNDLYISYKNNIAQLYFILGRAELR